MSRQSILIRCRTIWASIRGSIRSGITRRHLKFGVLWLGVIGGLGLSLLATEALVRARLEPPEARAQTAIWSRPVAWGESARRSSPALLGTVDGRPLELRVPVALDEISPHMVQAVLAIEDQRFYQHHGLDLWRIGGALVANLRAGRISQGGSTITQQLAKNLFLSSRRTPLRKLREATMAAVLEMRASKESILEAYLNETYLGQDGSRAIHGVGAAARFYFGTDAKDLTLDQSALLAGMIQAPNGYNPVRNPETARERRATVLRAMALQDRISEKGAERAANSRLGTRERRSQTVDARWFLDAARGDLPKHLPARGASIHTTLDPTLQRAAEQAVRDGLGRLRSRELQAALVAIDPRTGEILAMVGGRDYGTSQFNRAVAARRQPGSAFKPIVALAALSRGRDGTPRFTLASRIEDAPFSVRSGGQRWAPANYDRSFRGEVSLREALEASLNVPIARVGLDVGPEQIATTARALGITSPMRPVPSLALGSSEVTLVELVRAYGVLAAGGELAATRSVLSRSAAGDPLPPIPAPEKIRVTDPAEAYLVTSALEGVIQRGTGRALQRVNGQGSGLAGKTGTSDDWRDAWFVAYSPKLVVGVWVGYDDGRTVGTTGAGAALPIVSRFLDEVDSDDWSASFVVPDGIESAWVRGGEGSNWWESGTGCTRELFLEGTAPESDCGGFRLADWFTERLRNIDRDEAWGRGAERIERSVERWIERLLERGDRERRRGGGRP